MCSRTSLATRAKSESEKLVLSTTEQPKLSYVASVILCSIFKHLVILSCLRGLPAASVGSPVL